MLALSAVSVQLYVVFFFFSCPITYPHKYFTLAVVAVFTESAVANVDIFMFLVFYYKCMGGKIPSDQIMTF